MKNILNALLFSTILFSCNSKTSYEEYPVPGKENLWLNYTKEFTEFKIWSPTAEEVNLHLYTEGNGGEPIKTHQMESGDNGIWKLELKGDLNGTYYTYQVKVDGNWLGETPGIYAQAVGVNGERAMVLDHDETNPDGWGADKGPSVKYMNETVIYELHIRDISIHPESGVRMKGKYLGLAEEGTVGPNNVSTGIDHLKELGITHVHILPAFDYNSVDETKLDSAQFNWGYDPLNYNVPEGSYSTNPYDAEVRVKEFKQMVKALHDNGIGVILDVVYNHTGVTANSNFNLEVPGYYYRHWEEGKYSDAAACGNETASERAMMSKFIIESVKYWAKEYHIDGFRFDLMGIHDIETMNEVSKALKEVNPELFVYGEGWTAGDSPLPIEKRALKHHITQMPVVSAFCDDMRDGLKGSVFVDEEKGFVSGQDNTEESVKMGIVGCIEHHQIDYKAVNYSNAHWTNDPWQSISYVTCHDNHTLYDKLKISRSTASEDDIIAMDKLANAIVLTSQGTAFIHAGSEMLRTKNGNHNSYNSPDSVNQIDWNFKVANKGVVEYYKNLIKLRKQHPAFRMTSGDDVRNNLEFQTVESGLLSFQISNNANNDKWKNIYVVYNARSLDVNYKLDGKWRLAVLGDEFSFIKGKAINGTVRIPAISMMIVYQK